MTVRLSMPWLGSWQAMRFPKIVRVIRRMVDRQADAEDDHSDFIPHDPPLSLPSPLLAFLDH